MIFDFASQKETKSEIARALTTKGLERRNGKAWTPRQVTAILARADLYRAGFFRYGEAIGANDRLALARSKGYRPTTDRRNTRL